MSYVKHFTLLASAAYTAADTELLSEWVDVDDMNELLVWLNITAFSARSDETLVLTIERWALNTAGYTTIMTFDTINTTGAQSVELYEDCFLGGKIRARVVLAGTWSSKSMTFSVTAQAKCA
jgi:hypothetical protein